MRKIKEDGHQSGEDLKIQARNKMWFLTRSLIQLRRDIDCSRERNILELMVEHRCSVGYVARIIARGIVHSIRVVDPRYIVLRMRRQLGMLDITFLGFIQL